MTDDVRTWYEPLPVPHRTADRAFLLSSAVSLIVTVADVENSIYALRRPGAREANGIFGSHPNRGIYYGITMPLAAIDIGMGWHYKREDDALRAAGLPGHKWMKWWIPSLLNTATHAVGIGVTVGSTGR